MKRGRRGLRRKKAAETAAVAAPDDPVVGSTTRYVVLSQTGVGDPSGFGLLAAFWWSIRSITARIRRWLG